MICRRRKIDKIIKDEYWNGFFEGLAKGFRTPNSRSEHAEVRKIAHHAGYDHARKVVKHCVEVETWPTNERRRPGRHLFYSVDRKIPGRVYADCYGAARIAKC